MSVIQELKKAMFVESEKTEVEIVQVSPHADLAKKLNIVWEYSKSSFLEGNSIEYVIDTFKKILSDAKQKKLFQYPSINAAEFCLEKAEEIQKWLQALKMELTTKASNTIKSDIKNNAASLREYLATMLAIVNKGKISGAKQVQR